MKGIRTEVHSFVINKVISRFGPALLALVLGTGLWASTIGTVAAQTQEQGNNAEPGMHRHSHHKMPSVDDQVKRMTKKLNLNEDQQSKVRGILNDQRSQMERLRSDNSLSRDDRSSKMRELHENSSGQIRAALNDDQRKRFDEMLEKRRERMKRHGGENGPDGQQQPAQSK
jgi:Spy/CpxP family protein refolding chaperone